MERNNLKDNPYMPYRFGTLREHECRVLRHLFSDKVIKQPAVKQITKEYLCTLAEDYARIHKKQLKYYVRKWVKAGFLKPIGDGEYTIDTKALTEVSNISYAALLIDAEAVESYRYRGDSKVINNYVLTLARNAQDCTYYIPLLRYIIKGLPMYQYYLMAKMLWKSNNLKGVELSLPISREILMPEIIIDESIFKGETDE